MKILLTGSAGFIGFHTARKLLDLGYEVVGIDNFNDYYDPQIKRDRNKLLCGYKNFYSYEENIANKEKVKKICTEHTINKICHLAAQAGVRYSLIDPFSYEESNVKGFLVMLEVARHHDIHDFVFASSASVYGNNKMPKKGFSEKDRVDHPMSIYGATKRANELMAFSYQHLFGINCTALRFFSVYGPWGRPDMALFKFTKAILANEEVSVFNYGKMTRNFTYIDDIVSGVLAALQKPFPYEIFNLGNNRTVPLTHFITQIESELRKKAKIKLMPMQQGDIPDSLANVTHAYEELGFIPKTNVEGGIKQFIDWYKEYYQVK